MRAFKFLDYSGSVFSFINYNGTFNLAGNVRASKIAVYDGQRWCTYTDSLDNDVISADVYHDTIYIAGAFNSIDGDTSLKYIAKFLHPENTYERGPVGIE